MAKIQVLDNSLINKIAAGEVVERPYNIVKELTENSLDANSTEIDILITSGGLSSIVIGDNGHGIEKEYLKTAFLRHATSKIATVDDLFNIDTLGFRGEALSSIVSVSEVTVTTRTKNDELANVIHLIDGEVIEETVAYREIGTTIEVRNLFHNVPARLKFLKKPNIEASLVSDLVNTFILANPTVKFNYSINGNKMLIANGDGLKNSVYSVYGRETAKNSIVVNSVYNNIKVTGFIIKSHINKANRKSSMFFINNRFIKSKLLNEAVVDAYGQRLMIGKFPIFGLNIEISNEDVDVNVHPTKLEVRFSDNDEVYEAVRTAVKKALDEEDTKTSLGDQSKFLTRKEFRKPVLNEHIPTYEEISLEDVSTNTFNTQNQNDLKNNAYDFNKFSENTKSHHSVNEANDNKITNLNKDNNKQSLAELLNTNNIKQVSKEESIKKDYLEHRKSTTPNKVEKQHDYKIIGQVFGTYWILEKDESIYLLDQHAGHERITYERYKNELQHETVRSQMTLMPFTLTLSHSESVFLRKNLVNFKKLGYDIEEFGENIFAIRSFPMVLDKVTDISFFHDIMKNFKEDENIYYFSEETVIMKSCKASIKANMSISDIEAKKLIDELLNEGYLLQCPHGRPIMVKLTKKDIEKMFKRIV